VISGEIIEAKSIYDLFDAACCINVAMNAWLPQASYPCGTVLEEDVNPLARLYLRCWL
jgi:hypothetical protein